VDSILREIVGVELSAQEPASFLAGHITAGLVDRQGIAVRFAALEKVHSLASEMEGESDKEERSRSRGSDSGQIEPPPSATLEEGRGLVNLFPQSSASSAN
jgi:hypothetical protein